MPWVFMAVLDHRSGFPGGYLNYRSADPTIDRRTTKFSLTLATLFLLDIITTQFILWLGGIELNPAMAGLVTSPFVHIAIKAGTLLLIILVALIAERKVKGSSIAFYCVINTLYLFVIVNNTFVLIPHIVG
jgi:hypothetical protein